MKKAKKVTDTETVRVDRFEGTSSDLIIGDDKDPEYEAMLAILDTESVKKPAKKKRKDKR